MGEKKIETMKHRPVTMAVNPVRPPSAIPAPLSMKAVTGDDPKSAPIEIKVASVQYAQVDRGKSPSLGLTTPQKRTIEYKVAVASMISTYKKVKRARTNCEASPPAKVQSRRFKVLVMGCQTTICLKKSKRRSPSSLSGKKVMVVLRLCLEEFVSTQTVRYQTCKLMKGLTAKKG